MVDHFRPGILGWVLGDHSAETFQPLWEIVALWKCYFYVTDGWKVDPNFIPDGDQIVSKTYDLQSRGRKYQTPALSCSPQKKNPLLL